MDDFESRVREELRKVPGKGFTALHQASVHHSLNSTGSYKGRPSRARRLRALIVAAVAVVFGACVTIATIAQIPSHTASKHVQITMNQQIQQVLGHYGWHESGAPASVWTTRLPDSYVFQPGKLPVGLYWAYHNVLSASIGLDITPYLGKTVQVHLVPLLENWQVGPPEEITYAVVITANGKVVGAWAEKGGEFHLADVCESLSHKEFGDLVKQTWGAWTAQEKLVNYADSFYSRMEDWTSKQLLQAYFAAINAHNENQAYAMMSTMTQYQYMLMNVPVGHLYNSSWDASNWATAKFISLKPYHYPNASAEPGHAILTDWEAKLYNAQNVAWKYDIVTFEATFYHPGPLNNGKGGYYTTLVKEVPGAPWTINGFGTGP